MERWTSLLLMTATLLLVLSVVALGVVVISAIHHTVLLFTLGGLLAYALDPLVEKLRGSGQPRQRMSRGRSVMLVFSGFMLLMVGSVVALSHTVTRQIGHLNKEHTLYEQRAKEKLDQTDVWLAKHGVRVNLSQYVMNPPENVRAFGQRFASNALKMFGEASKDLVEGFLVLLIAVYFLVYSEEMCERMRATLKDPLRSFFDLYRDDVNRILGGFVRGQVVLAIIMGIGGAIICLCFGLHLWLLIGLFVMVTSLIPVFGPVIGAIPAVLGVLLMPTSVMGLKVGGILLAFVVLNEVHSKVLYPRLVGNALGLHEVLVLFVLLGGMEVSGMAGVLFSAPLTALAYVSVLHLYRLWQGLPPKRFAPDPTPRPKPHLLQKLKPSAPTAEE
jgi:predicted PurR-regulated permease PerM